MKNPRTCKRCGVSASPGLYSWPRYEKNGKRKVICGECDALADERRAIIADAKTRGYISAGHTPEYKRMQYERTCATSGKQPKPYLTAEAKRLIAALKRQRVTEEKDCKDAYKAWIGRFKTSDNDKWRTRYSTDVAFRERQLERSRAYYGSNRDKCLRKSKTWKHANPELHAAQGDRRVVGQFEIIFP